MGTIRRMALCAALSAVAAGCTPTGTTLTTDPARTGSTNGQIDADKVQIQEDAHRLAREPPVLPSNGRQIAEDHSGRKQVGTASVYSPRFQARKMANGQPFDHRGNAAASKTLPLGTIAKVTNTDNGRTAEVTIEDRGPYVNGRTLDVTTSTAQQLGIDTEAGIAPVVVAPVAVPQANGTIKPGAGALPGPATSE